MLCWVLSYWESLYCYIKCQYTDCRCTEYCNTECCYLTCLYAECCYDKFFSTECHYSECFYSEWHYYELRHFTSFHAECRNAMWCDTTIWSSVTRVKLFKRFADARKNVWLCLDDTWTQCYTTFYDRNLRTFAIK